MTPRSRLAWLSGGVVAGAGLLGGCASDRQYTPTTQGTDLSTLPRGRMTPQPFPGVDLVRKGGQEPSDPGVRMAGAGDVDRPIADRRDD